MSQIYKYSAGGGGVPIQTINGDVGSISGITVTIYADKAANNSGETVKFVNSGTVSTLDLTDAQQNTFIGQLTGNATNGGSNTALGYSAMNAAGNATENTAIGNYALLSILSGINNVAIGQDALNFALYSLNNTAIGHSALERFTGTLGNTGNNTALGFVSLAELLTGVDNIAVGSNSGSQYESSESSNIVIGNTGVTGESNVIRIGTQGSGAGQQNECFIAGIVGVTVSNTELVTINSSTGQMGVTALNPSGFPWVDATGATQALAINTGYVTDHSATVVYTLPASASLGDVIKIVGKLGLATITPNANQKILIGSASGTVGATGTAVSNNVGDCIELYCITAGASTVWRAGNMIGTWTLN